MYRRMTKKKLRYCPVKPVPISTYCDTNKNLFNKNNSLYFTENHVIALECVQGWYRVLYYKKKYTNLMIEHTTE